MAQIFYEDVKVGDVIPEVIEHPTRRQLVMWAGAAQEFSEMHYDNNFAVSHGFPGVIVHGMLNNSFLAKMVQHWAGDDGMIRKFKSSNRHFILVDEDVICSGAVVRKYEQNGQNLIDCEVKVMCNNEYCVFGEITVDLPRRK